MYRVAKECYRILTGSPEDAFCPQDFTDHAKGILEYLDPWDTLGLSIAGVQACFCDLTLLAYGKSLLRDQGF